MTLSILKWHMVGSCSSYLSTVAALYKKNIDKESSISKIFDSSARRCKVLLEDSQIKGLLVYKNNLQNKYRTDSLQIKACIVNDHSSDILKIMLQEIIHTAERRRAQHIMISECDVVTKNFFEKNYFHIISIKIKDFVEKIFLSASMKEFESLPQKRKREEIEEAPRKKFREIYRPCELPISSAPIIHQVTLRKQYIDQIRSGLKTVEGRINNGMFVHFKEGDKVRFFYQQNPGDDVLCEIEKMQIFASFREMLATVGHQNCLPYSRDLDAAVLEYSKIPGYEARAARFGVVAISLKVVSNQNYSYS